MRDCGVREKGKPPDNTRVNDCNTDGFRHCCGGLELERGRRKEVGGWELGPPGRGGEAVCFGRIPAYPHPRNVPTRRPVQIPPDMISPKV